MNKEVYSFLQNHQQDLYSPSLVFEAIGRKSFILHERLISIDRLLYAIGKHQKQWKGTDLCFILLDRLLMGIY